MNIVGINKDAEVLENWKIYMLLLSGNNNHKIFKICYPIQDAFAIVLPNFETKCESYANKYNRLKENSVKQIQTKSFLEKSSAVDSKYSIDALAEKFSVEELVKIKSLIKFAKRNKVIDKIYEKGGDVDINDIIEKPKVVDNKKEIDELKNVIKTQNDKIGKLIDLVNNNTLAINDHKTQESLHFKQIDDNIKDEARTIKSIESKVNEQKTVNKTEIKNELEKLSNETKKEITNTIPKEQISVKTPTPEQPKIVQKDEPKNEVIIESKKIQQQSNISDNKKQTPQPQQIKQKPKAEPPKQIVSPLLTNRYYAQDDDYFFDTSPKSNTQNQATSIYDDFLNP
jgi:hypothetical protein